METNKEQQSLTDLSNKELDDVYMTLSRGIQSGEVSKQMEEIQNEMQRRYVEFNDKSKEK